MTAPRSKGGTPRPAAGRGPRARRKTDTRRRFRPPHNEWHPSIGERSVPEPALHPPVLAARAGESSPRRRDAAARLPRFYPGSDGLERSSKRPEPYGRTQYPFAAARTSSPGANGGLDVGY